MKRLVLLPAIALIISSGLYAQDATPANKEVKDQTRTQVRTRDQDHDQDQVQQQVQDRIHVRDQVRVKDGTGMESRAQTREKATKEERKMLKEQRKAEKMAQKKQNHGRIVSETARNTESGPGKGEIVSTQARTQGEMQRARVKTNNSVRNRSGSQAPRGNTIKNNQGVSSGSGPGRR